MSQKTLITVAISVLVLIVVVVAVAKIQSQEQQDASNTSSSSTNTTQQREENSMSDDLKIEDIVVGDGAEAIPGKEVTVHYTGTFTNGTKFDSSVDRGEPFTFTLGAGEVIKGWDQGVAGMKVGGKRKLTVPPELGYGAQDYASIPGGSTLLFDVELLEVK